MIGQTISHYEVVEKLGSGGMGIVYKARDLRLQRFVALKFLPLDLSTEEEFKARFVQEARAASALDHANICTVHEINETDDGQMFIAMAYYPGETLKRKIQRGPLRLADALNFAIQIARGLAKAHQNGIVHRDIKPANVMVTEDGVVKILDFGLAQLAGATRLTKTGSTLGTPAYMSPEQVQRQPLDRRTDIWSLGVLFYEMVTGQVPFAGGIEAAVAYAILHEEPEPLTGKRTGVTIEWDSIVSKLLNKNPNERYQHIDEVLVDLRALQKDSSATTKPKQHRKTMDRRALAVGLALVVVVLLAFLWFDHRPRGRLNRAEVILNLQEYLSTGEALGAFVLARRVRDDLAGDAEFETLWDRIARQATITTAPSGARISVRPYGSFSAPWIEIGTSPLARDPFPRSPMQLKIEKEGYRAREVLSINQILRGDPDAHFVLSDLREADDGLVSVPAEASDVLQIPASPASGVIEPVQIQPFQIDRFEVTNNAYKEFVEAGGYERREFWKYPFLLNGETVRFEDAMKHFIDATGRQGPATWRLGTYPDDHGDYPVAGVSWFEAAAFAEFVGARLPTLYHFHAAAGSQFPQFLVRNSNFGNGPQPVGKAPARSPVGAADMAGNVREWCWNANGDNRLILGGAWGDPDYFFGYFHSRDPWDRNPGNGFRCARYDPTLVSAELMGPIQRKVRDYSTEQPVDDEQFEVFRRQYSYDPTALSADIHEERDEPHWKLEKVSYDSAYGERIPAYLYLPNAVEPPYQAVIFCPGSGGEYFTDSELTPLQRAHVELLTRTGRAVLRPVYKGLYERQVRDPDPVYLTLDPPVRTAGPRARRDLVILAIRDVMRSVDYLESRDEIRANAIAYLGLSLSARLGAIVLGLDQRFKAAVLWDGGLHLTPKELRLPEEDEMNFLPRVQTPTLMINARYDGVFPTEWSQRYFFEWLGVPANLKRHVLFDRGHGAGFLNDDEMREIVAWLDRHLGVP